MKDEILFPFIQSSSSSFWITDRNTPSELGAGTPDRTNPGRVFLPAGNVPALPKPHRKGERRILALFPVRHIAPLSAGGISSGSFLPEKLTYLLFSSSVTSLMISSPPIAFHWATNSSK